MEVLRSLRRKSRCTIRAWAALALRQHGNIWHCVSTVNINKYAADDDDDAYGGTDFKLVWWAAFQSYAGRFGW